MVTGGTQALRVCIGLASVPILARLLDPEDFGLFATVAVITNFALMFVDAGLSMATIQREEISRQQISNLFWITTGLGLAITLVVTGFAPLISWLYGEPRLVALIVATSVSFLFAGLTIQHQALLRRCMFFKRLAAIDLFSMLAGQLVALFWAWKYSGTSSDYWALALIPISTSAFRLAGVWLSCSWIPGRPRRGCGSRQMVSFGGRLTLGQAANYIAASADLLVVGYFFGERVLGHYERSSMLAVQPVRQINGPLTAVCVPAFSRLASSPDKYYRAYRTAVTLVGWVMIPLAAVFIVHADVMVTILLGEGWEFAVPIFRVLSFGLIALPVCNVSAWLLISQGRGKDTLLIQTADAVMRIFLVLSAVPFGGIGVAAASSVRQLIMPFFLFRIIGRQGPVSAKMIWTLLAGHFAAFATVASALVAIRSWLPPDVMGIYQSAAVAVATAVIVNSAVFICFPFVRSEFSEFASSFRPLPQKAI